MMVTTAKCTLCAKVESPGFYTGCMVKDGHVTDWNCDGNGNLTWKLDAPEEDNSMNEYPEPVYEAEDIGCDCTDAGIESEWEWTPDQNAYVCNGCGEVQ
ncbi:hypothetical protein [Bradyrhizobium elkanii]|uniref:Uncharacterized protein n=2 Tax=Bradyrhizobium elkanii TaxID=29448 RepID=A0ABV4F3R8_BRAEL|nr:hypothetical protein [Bradyrhizobium elkanii]MCP1932185.1 hypothetical protein [Bradyrhizobium elkanii]MCS3577275.1 hypothetical protein [Bradyrhizobium elkanii]MCS3720152.1 hypothetical protein [Bradyrhizobium elkanii]MCS3881085.1 hypothetical protein [Bradyrhizobium elkanii]MCS4004569.1 hypothetical protein [Bradyrhizobium elkanii USDA 61]